MLINTAKGLEVGTRLRMSQVVESVIPGSSQRFVALYGPSHAEEVGLRASRCGGFLLDPCADRRRRAGSVYGTAFRVYTNDDLIGVEIGGAIKNIIAIATGIATGLGLGDNAQAALLTRGMAEITRLGYPSGR